MKLYLLTFAIAIANISLLAQNTPPWWMVKSDSMSGVDLFRAFELLKESPPVEETIIAVLDTDTDITHKDLKKVLWTNTEDASVDQLDNDKNGYIDDLHGWNFLGTKGGGKSLRFTLMEETRILRKYDKEAFSKFLQNKVPYSYEEVQNSYDTIVKNLTEDIIYYSDIESTYVKVLDTLKKVLRKDNITLATLQSNKTEDTFIKQCIEYAQDLLEQGYPYEEIVSDLEYKKKSLEICMNMDYDNRLLIGDEQENIRDRNYGSAVLGGITNTMAHGTKVVGVIAKSLTVFAKEYSNPLKIKIMPLCITGIGDPLDKDTALAICYAVDNGAKVINLSQTKTFSLQEHFINKALKYAERKDVLIVKSSGNDGVNLDHEVLYPNDTNRSGKEFVNNMIVVGGTTKFTDTRIAYESSNYGSQNVDVFAPGEDIDTLLPNDKYTTSTGTSYAAPIVSTIAALIRSYYPSLTAPQVKEILMESGTSYNITIELTEKDDSKKTVPFSSLSKSGKVVNAYNALIMAESLAKK